MKTIGLSGALALLLLTQPLSAQRTGTRLDQSVGRVGSINKSTVENAIIAANAFAQCIARRETKGVKKALDLPLASAEQGKLLNSRTYLFDDCMTTQNEDVSELAVTPMLMAGGAAEWFVRTDFKRVDLSKLQRMTDEALGKTGFAPKNGLEDFGLCILRSDPEQVRRLLTTLPTSKAEKEAIRPLITHVGPCTPAKQTVKMNIANLRAVLSFAAYRAASGLASAS